MIPRLYVKEFRLLIFHICKRGKSVLGLSVGNGGTGRSHFCTFPLPWQHWQMHPGPVLSPCLNNASGCAQALHSPFASLSWWACAVYKRVPPDHLDLVARRAYISGSQGTVTIRDTVFGSLPLPGHYTDHSLKHTSSLHMIKACLFVLDLHPEEQTSDLPHI